MDDKCGNKLINIDSSVEDLSTVNDNTYELTYYLIKWGANIRVLSRARRHRAWVQFISSTHSRRRTRSWATFVNVKVHESHSLRCDVRTQLCGSTCARPYEVEIVMRSYHLYRPNTRLRVCKNLRLISDRYRLTSTGRSHSARTLRKENKGMVTLKRYLCRTKLWTRHVDMYRVWTSLRVH